MNSTFANEFDSMVTETVTWYPMTGRDRYGVPTYSLTGTNFDARVERRHRMTTNKEGKEVISSCNAVLIGSPSIDPQDRVLLNKDGTKPQIISVEEVPDEVGPCYTKVYFL